MLITNRYKNIKWP